ncbi:MAG: CDGSH iron-sulfur domain-containing protein [Candidatus Aminicenantales bacterium]|jgi:CDGSH-type Zn-finger protein
MSDSKNIGRIKVTKDGPYIVTGKVPLAQDRMIIGTDGEPAKWEKGATYPDRGTSALCRCGRSKDKPFCDGSHFEIAFDGTETAGRDAYLKHAEKTAGPGLDLTWSPEFCAVARFCHRGEEAWGYAERSDDPTARKTAVEEACACPSGSLVAWDKTTGEAIEAELEPSIRLIENPKAGTSGPIWVKGGIPIESADGVVYETRNRMTLCRCGLSKNKPFCDGTHVSAGFKSGA